MATTQIPWGDARAVKRWSAKLAIDIQRDGYFAKRFVGKGQNNCIEEKTDLERDAGDTIQFDLLADLNGLPTFGDNRVEGNEEQLRFSTDRVVIDQMRKAVSAGGRMSRKRTVHDLRQTANLNLKRYWAKFIDQMHFMVLSGTRGHNEDYTMPQGTSSFAGNAFLAPDATHTLYAGSATSKATLTASDTMTRLVIERAVTKAKMLKSVTPDASNMVPLSVEGAERYVIVMSPFQAHDMRTDAGAGNWFDIQKALAGAEGSKNRICTGGLGMINNAVLHEHSNVIRFNDYGAGNNVAAARALMLACQAAVVAYGSPDTQQRFIWKEVMKDYENEPAVAGGYIYGEKKTRFNGYDFGVISIDTAARNPN